jgi:small subunit ribosomal protein S8e
MVIIHGRSKRTSTGARMKTRSRKRLFQRGNLPTLTTLSEKKVRVIREKGGERKSRLLSINLANVYDPKSKKFHKAKILNIVENPANRNYVRRNIITRGTIMETDKGKARVTSRPGQEGAINAVLIH